MPQRQCPRCQRLLRRVVELEVRIRELEARLNQNASNSSIPPSANPPQAPKPVVKEPTGRKPGGQPGHQAHQRVRLPPEQVQHTIPLIPDRCERCATSLPVQPGAHDPEPSWHQVTELPRLAAVTT